MNGPSLTEFVSQLIRVCPECERVFHLDREEDSAEYFFGHDCEA